MAVKRWNGSAWVAQAGTIAATSDNTVNTIVQRDRFGNFSAGEVTATSVLASNFTGNTPSVNAFITTNNLTLGSSLGYSNFDATNKVLSGGVVVGTFASPTVTDNYSVRNITAGFDYVDHTINIGTGTVTNNANVAYKNINIGTGSLINGGLTTVQINASGGVTNFYGNVNLPSTTLIGNVSATEIGYLDGVTSAIQTQLDSKQRLVAKLTAATAAIANTETRIIGFTAAANTIVAGDTFRFTGYATRAGTNTGTATFRIRITQTTLVGTASFSTTTASLTPGVYKFEALVTVRTVGTIGSAGGVGKIDVTTTSGANSFTNVTPINTTVLNVVEATIVSGVAGNTYTFEYAILEKLPA